MKTPSVVTTFLLALVGCGGGSGTSDALSAPGDTGSTGACNFPSCLQALGSQCAPQGTCKSDQSSSTMTVCYANGFRFVESASATGAVSFTAGNGSTACFTGTASLQAGTSLSYTINNMAGTTVATMTQDVSTGAASITCVGGQPTPLSAACWGGTGCDLGTCP